MNFNSALGETYLEGMRISLRKGAGKSTIISYLESKIRKLIQQGYQSVSIADFGSCEGEMLDQIKKLFPQFKLDLHGFDYNANLIHKSQESYKDIKFHLADLSKDDFGEFSNFFDIVFTVNTLHEVFSFTQAKRGNFKARKKDVDKALASICSTVKPEGSLVIYDGIESDTDPKQKVTVQLQDGYTEQLLKKFDREYIPLDTVIKQVASRTYEMSSRLFTRFITKLRFLDSVLWQIEKEESYQYFTKSEFIYSLRKKGFIASTIVLIRPRFEEWKNRVRIISPHNFDFPFEHILIIASRNGTPAKKKPRWLGLYN